jgi:hypothetical protein
MHLLYQREDGSGGKMNWAIDELRMKRQEWEMLFQLCIKYKQWDLLEEYWTKTEGLFE